MSGSISKIFKNPQSDNVDATEKVGVPVSTNNIVTPLFVPVPGLY